MSKADKAWFLFQSAEATYWSATGAALGWGAAEYALTSPRSTRGLVRARSMASFGIRAHAAALHGVMSTPLVRGGSQNLYRVGGQVLAGYIIGAAVGTMIAGAIWGEEGADTAAALYLPQFLGGDSFDDLDYFGTIGRKLGSYS